MNKVKLKGGLAKDAEIVGTNPQNLIVKMRVITSDSWNDRQTGEKKTSSTGHNVSVFGWKARQLAENIQFLTKGAKVSVAGKLNYIKSNTSDKWYTQIEVNDSPLYEVDIIVRFAPKHQQQTGYQNRPVQQQAGPVYQQAQQQDGLNKTF